MGVSGVAVAAVLAVAALGWMSVLSSAHEAARQEATDAHRDSERRSHDRLQTKVAFDVVAHEVETERLTIAATNTGSASLDASKVDVLLDGEWANTLVESSEVDQKGSSVWSPGTQLVLVLRPVAADPDRVVLFTEHGAAFYHTR